MDKNDRLNGYRRRCGYFDIYNGTFAGLMNVKDLIFLIIVQYLFKVIYEVVATPLTYLIVLKIKKIEKVDVYDYNERYNPMVSKEDL